MVKVSAILMLLSLLGSEANERNLRTVARAKPQGTMATATRTPAPVPKTPAPIRTTPKPSTTPPIPIVPPKSVTLSPISIDAPLRGIYTSFPSTSPSTQFSNHQGTKAIANVVSPAPTLVSAPKTPAPIRTTPPDPIVPPKSVTSSPISIDAPLRGIYTSFPSTSPSSHVGTITGRDAALPMDLPDPEEGFKGLPKMESIPAGVEGSTFTPPKTDDLIDSPNAIDGGVTDSQSASEIPAMEQIPNNIKATPPFIADAVDMPYVIDDVPVLLPFGNNAENYVLHQTASVCATSEQVAFSRCEQEPVCKYVTHNGGVVTSELKSGQGDCIRRCDAPLGETQCEPHEQCFHFVLACKVDGW